MTAMKPFLQLAAAVLLLGAFTASAQRETLGVLPVKPLPATAEKLARAGKKLSLEQVAQSLAEQQADALNGTRKFQIVARNDLAGLVQDDERANTLSTDRVKGFNLADTKYLLVTSIDDFEDQTQRLEQRTAGTTLTRRTVRLAVIAKIYEASTGKLLESASQSFTGSDVSETMNAAGSDAEGTDALLRTVSRQGAEWLAARVTDVVFPAKVIAKTGKVVTFNRGEGTGVASGQVWRVFVLGEELVDPDTKEVLGREEVEIGKVRITDVLPRFSRAEVVEDLGIATGAVLRP